MNDTKLTTIVIIKPIPINFFLELGIKIFHPNATHLSGKGGIYSFVFLVYIICILTYGYQLFIHYQ